MQDNSTNDIMETLIKYMDGELSAQEQPEAEKLLQDAAVQERYENLLHAKHAIRSRGLKERVQTLHQEFYKEVQPQSTAKIVTPSFGVRAFMRIAAVLILVVAGYGVYQYSTTNNESLYNDNFISYQLPLVRGTQQINDIDSLYNANNFAAVINNVNAKSTKTQQDYFLAAQSYLQVNDAVNAIAAFQKVEELNNASSDKYYVQETDYYLALAYIKANNITAAEKQLQKITANNQHMFYRKAKEISNTKLTILKWKE